MLLLLICAIRYSPAGRERVHNWIQVYRAKYVGSIRGSENTGSVEVGRDGNGSGGSSVRQSDTAAGDIEMNKRGGDWKDISLWG